MGINRFIAIGYFAAAVFALPTARAYDVTAGYSDNSQEIAQVFYSVSRKELARMYWDYRAQMRNPRALATSMKELLFSSAEVQSVQNRLGVTQRAPLPPATWEDDEIILSSGRNTIEIGIPEYESGVILVNGHEFAWRRDLSVAKNLEIYDKLFYQDQSTSLFEFLVPSAYAASYYSIQAAGLMFSFALEKPGLAKQTLNDLNAAVAIVNRSCESYSQSHPRATQDEFLATFVSWSNFSSAGQEEAAIAKKSSNPFAHVHDKKDVRKFMPDQVKVGRPPLLKQGDVAFRSSCAEIQYYAKAFGQDLPPGQHGQPALCDTLDSFAKCIKSHVRVAAQDSSAQADPSKPSAGEWGSTWAPPATGAAPVMPAGMAAPAVNGDGTIAIPPPPIGAPAQANSAALPSSNP